MAKIGTKRQNKKAAARKQAFATPAKGFLSLEISGSSPVNPVADNLRNPVDEYESLRLLAIGSHKGVTSTIHTLHALRFAQFSEWSPLLPAPNPGEVMSILTRRIKRSL